MTKTVLITGANGGIGNALCSSFKNAGYYVIGTDRSKSAKCECDHYISADLYNLANDVTQLNNFKTDVFSTTKTVNTLINNAAVQILSSLSTLKLEDFKKTLDVNLTAALLLTQGFEETLTKCHGSVINIGSIHAGLTKPAFISYATSKAALRGLTKSLAVDLGGRIRVNCIEPAAIETDMLVDGFKDTPEKLNELTACHPTGKLGQPFEIAKAAVFLTNSDNEFMTGTILEINGGIAGRLHDPF